MPETMRSPRAIRVGLIGVSGLTAGLVRECLDREADMLIAAECRWTDDLVGLATEDAIDVVITARADGVADACRDLLFGERGLPVIAIAAGGAIEIYQRHQLREAAMDDLLQEIRRVAARGPWLGAAPPRPQAS